MREKLTHGHSCSWLGDLAIIRRFKGEVSYENPGIFFFEREMIGVCMRERSGRVKLSHTNITYAMMAFISIMAMVRPIQACGPVMKESRENVGL